ncbi:hypothetical protein [Treponema sp.]|uniref:hypothetical protein n=1 Tax=Treponema sp. TaxID=166 RepID=UPI00298E7C35|nr:hypothetical protein [Treponema sp.]MCQ2242098.1 hypothetical protein [Treponema sp.]
MAEPYEKLDEEMKELSGGRIERKIEEKRKYDEITDKFRELFMSDTGKFVFNVILEDLNFFQPCHTDGEVALRNYATFLIEERLGIKNTGSIAEKLLQADYS